MLFRSPAFPWSALVTACAKSLDPPEIITLRPPSDRLPAYDRIYVELGVDGGEARKPECEFVELEHRCTPGMSHLDVGERRDTVDVGVLEMVYVTSAQASSE